MITVAQILKRGDASARIAVARERLIAQGHTRSEVDEMPDEVVAEALARTIVATCKCGLEYEAEGWSSLPRVGLQDLTVCGDGVLELRNCTCNSTISRRIV